MSFTSENLNGQWCAPGDCVRVLGSIETVLRNNIGPLNTAISQATGRAKSVLRSRWPDSWPFSSPPDELREAVAVIAIHRAAAGALLASGAHETAEQLRRDRKEALQWLDDIADSKAHLELAATAEDHGSPAVAAAPTGEFGLQR